MRLTDSRGNGPCQIGACSEISAGCALTRDSNHVLNSNKCSVCACDTNRHVSRAVTPRHSSSTCASLLFLASGTASLVTYCHCGTAAWSVQRKSKISAVTAMANYNGGVSIIYIYIPQHARVQQYHAVMFVPRNGRDIVRMVLGIVR
jgi:hypothetical protein